MGAVKSAASLTRRSLLGLGALGLAACTKGSSPAAHGADRGSVDPDAGLLASAHGNEQVLVAAYDSAIPSASGAERARLTAERALHATHLHALGKPTPLSPSLPPGDVDLLLRGSTDLLRGAAVEAADGAHAAVFASIAASHEAMLRD
jgi:hypothetical protein